jgi:beta-aspartyl-peptidase (threonine type)
MSIRYGVGLVLIAAAGGAGDAAPPAKVVLAVHGGAGGRPEGGLTAAEEKLYHADLESALKAGLAVLRRDGGSALDAVQAAVVVLEDSPRFNAGRGAVFNRDGRNELDAAIIDGRDRKAGAVAGVMRVKNPILAARAVMDKSKHVLMAGEGADRFAAAEGLAVVSPAYFWTAHRWEQFQKRAARREEREKAADPYPKGTVGAVAVDRGGNLAAATSTGGLTDKRPGRVGDTPLIGAGTFADNATCAVSATGEGELFIRSVVAYDIAARMKYAKAGVRDAAGAVIKDLPADAGGVIALDKDGVVAMPFNTEGMWRGWITADGKVGTAIDPD